MTEFVVVIAPSAERDIERSFAWGCEYWGFEMAVFWVNELRDTIEKELPLLPKRFAIAPDDDGTGREFRQMFVGRYRVIFHIREERIYVVHVRGPFSGSSDKNMGVDQ